EAVASALARAAAGQSLAVDFQALLASRPMRLGVAGEAGSGDRLDGVDDPGFGAALRRSLSRRGISGSPVEIQALLVRALGASGLVAPPSAAGDRPLTVVLVSRSTADRLEAVIARSRPNGEGAAPVLALLPLDAEGEAAIARWNPADRRVERWTRRIHRSLESDPWDLREVESTVRSRLNPSEFSSCRILAGADVPLRAGGLETALFRDAMVWLMDGLFPVSVTTSDLDRLTRLSRLVATAA
ncbi:MAG TPA: hypothetical protein PKX64_09735, partial [Elusimicrobiota bacterium]|nr:hypothetical protein [Elusimicrobiota bacterium]